MRIKYLKRFARKNSRGVGGAGSPDPRSDVFLGLLESQKGQPAANANSLAKLPEFRLAQFFIKLRLAGEENLHKFAVRILQVQQQAQFVEGPRGKRLRFVDHDHRRVAFGLAQLEPAP